MNICVYIYIYIHIHNAYIHIYIYKGYLRTRTDGDLLTAARRGQDKRGHHRSATIPHNQML